MPRKLTLVHEYEERLLQVAGHAVGKVLECYKRKQLTAPQLRRMKLLEEVCQRIEVLYVMSAETHIDG